jgi:hypothetical protein
LPRRRLLAAALAAAVAGLGLSGLVFQQRLGARLPSDLDWRAAAAVLARDTRPGDAVALSPGWAERGRLALPPGLPVLAFPRYAAEDLLGVRRLWVLALADSPGGGGAGAIERDLLARAGRHEPAQRIGALALSRHDLASPALARAFLPDLLAPGSGPARVRRGEVACAPDAAGQLRCGDEPGPSRQVRAVEGLPRPCIAVRAGPLPFTLAFSGLPSGTRLRGHAGLVDPTGRAREPAGPPLRVALRAPGAEDAVRLEGPGWRPLDLGAAPSKGTPSEVEIVVGEDRAGREVCVDAWVAE